MISCITYVHYQNVFHCKVKAAILEMRGSEAESKYFGHVMGTHIKAKRLQMGIVTFLLSNIAVYGVLNCNYIEL